MKALIPSNKMPANTHRYKRFSIATCLLTFRECISEVRAAGPTPRPNDIKTVNVETAAPRVYGVATLRSTARFRDPLTAARDPTRSMIMLMNIIESG
eukprot:CAMPEP_0185036720 /NCGR_PEP_ID=MMETSP1103-20130426/30081_1 /TAXON_ID=36769 /ORGANISM="Paraphysomonas bandaiensis, Strain Caron Lab Isolate" /LENGTH=96 /DNA_ID=CAMNT_0027574353 /DNA_START=100 /DNA_END=386 /DNA_ORIENTATION=+